MRATPRAAAVSVVAATALLAANGVEATVVPGGINVDTTWTADGNPYVVVEPTRINKGATLTIQAGVEVRFNKSWSLIVYGTLRALGTQGNPIVFTSNSTQTPGVWDKIDLSGNEAASSVLRNCIVRYAGALFGAITCANMDGPTYPTFRGVVIEDSNTAGIDCRDASPLISRCTFRRCNGYPIWQWARASPVYGAPSVFTGNKYDAVGIQGGSTQMAWWQDPGVPYRVTGAVRCEDGDVLTIDPGARLEFHERSYLWVAGTLNAVGQPGSRIVFTAASSAPGPGFWDCINFRGSTSSGSVVRNCRIEYAGSGGGEAIRCQYLYDGGPAPANPTIENTIIQDNRRYGIWCENSSPTIGGCTFRRNANYPIVLQPSSSPTYSAPSTFTDNGADVVAIGKGNWITATWSSPGCPLEVLGTIWLNDGHRLTVAPDTRVQFWKSAQLTLDGGLTAVGTPALPIVFTSAAATPRPGDWCRLHFRDGSQTSSLRFCTVQYAGASGNGAICCSNMGSPANTSIRDTVIRRSSNHGIVCEDTNPRIGGCTFRQCEDYPIYLKRSASPRYTAANVFLSNGREAVGVEGGLWRTARWRQPGIPYEIVDRLSVAQGSALTIDRGVIVRFCSGVAMIVSGRLLARGTAEEQIVFTSYRTRPQPGDWEHVRFETVESSGSVLQHCRLRYGGHSGYGIVCCDPSGNELRANPLIEDCAILNSSSSGVRCIDCSPRLRRLVVRQNQGPGLLFREHKARSVVRDCTIVRNGIGVQIISYAKPNLGDLGNARSTDDGGNVIHSNTQWDVRNESAKLIKAEGNYWGTTSAALIEKHIYDQLDDPAVGRVDFRPFLLGPLGLAQAPQTVQVTSLVALSTSAGTQITFSLSSAAQVRACILNIAGRPIRTLCQAKDCEAGASTLLWNAQSDQGTAVPNGTYLVEVMAKAGDGAETRALTQVHLNR